MKKFLKSIKDLVIDHPYLTGFAVGVLLISYAVADLSGKSGLGLLVVGIGVLFGSLFASEDS